MSMIQDNWKVNRIPKISGYISNANSYSKLEFNYKNNDYSIGEIRVLDIDANFLKSLIWVECDIYSKINYLNLEVFCGCGSFEEDGFVLLENDGLVSWVFFSDLLGAFDHMFIKEDVLYARCRDVTVKFVMNKGGELIKVSF